MIKGEKECLPPSVLQPCPNCTANKLVNNVLLDPLPVCYKQTLDRTAAYCRARSCRARSTVSDKDVDRHARPTVALSAQLAIPR